MASKYPQHVLTSRLAEQGDKTIPPETAIEAGSGRFSQAEGWRIETAQPIEEGGVPPKREDFNGTFNLLSEWPYWAQQGGLAQYSVVFDYEVGNEVLQSGKKYKCVQENGPATKIVDPATDTDHAYWDSKDEGELRYDRKQTLTKPQQAQARENADALCESDLISLCNEIAKAEG